jgi:hypothetical protein
MRSVRRLLKSGKAEVGSLSTDGSVFIPWNLPVEAAVSRIDTEWDKLGQEPDMTNLVAVFRPVEHKR